MLYFHFLQRLEVSDDLIPSYNSWSINPHIGKIDHGAHPLLISGQLLETLTQLIDEEVQGGKGAIGKRLLAKLFPEMLSGIEFWTVGRLRE
jgi:hypothetical protein